MGGDFNRSAFSTVGDVFADPEFAAPGNSLLWGLGALDDPCRERTGFLIVPKRLYEWRVDSHGCYKFNNADLGFAPRETTAHFPPFTCAPPTSLAPTALLAVNMLSSGAWNEQQQASMNAGGTAGDAHSLQHPDVPVPSSRENIELGP